MSKQKKPSSVKIYSGRCQEFCGPRKRFGDNLRFLVRILLFFLWHWTSTFAVKKLMKE